MKLTNPTMVQIAQECMNQVPEKLREAVTNAVMAGTKLMHAKETRQMLTKQMSQEGMSPAEKVGEGCAKLISIIFSDAQGKMPLRALIPAGVILTLTALEFLADAGVFDEITNTEIDEAVQEYSSSFLQLLGVTPEKLQQMLEQSAAQQGQPGAEQAPAEAPPEAGIVAGQQGV